MSDADKEKREKDYWLLLLALLIRQSQKQIGQLVDKLLAGDLSPQQFGQVMFAVLVGAHTHAAYLGRQKAGDISPFDDADLAVGGTFAAEQRDQYLTGFIHDLAGGRYVEDGAIKEDMIRKRALMYAGPLTGTANAAWGMTLPQDTALWWRVGKNENHCSDCPELEDGNPYTAATIPTWPRLGKTKCGSSCYCYVETDDGEESFRADLWQDEDFEEAA